MRKFSFTKRNRSKDRLQLNTDLGKLSFKINLKNTNSRDVIVIDLDESMKVSIINNSLFLERK